MKRLTQPAGVNIEEENNTVSITAPAMLGRGHRRDSGTGRDEPRAARGQRRRGIGRGGEWQHRGEQRERRFALTDVGGPVIAHATNGRVVATLRQLAAGKPMSFTSFNGDVDVTLPASAKANLKMRSDRGDVYTDFEVQTTRPLPPPAPVHDAIETQTRRQPEPHPRRPARTTRNIASRWIAPSTAR